MGVRNLRSWSADPLVRFFVIAGTLYILWYALHALWIHPHGALDTWLVDRLAHDGGVLLRAMGYELLPPPVLDNNRYIGVQGGHHLWIGDECNGLSCWPFPGLGGIGPGSSPWASSSSTS